MPPSVANTLSDADLEQQYVDYLLLLPELLRPVVARCAVPEPPKDWIRLRLSWKRICNAAPVLIGVKASKVRVFSEQK